jgi:hypothetical protein
MPTDTKTSSAESAVRNRELAARIFNERLMEAAQQMNDRLGPAHGTREVNWPEIIELWEATDPDLDIERAWDDAAKQAAMLIEQDKTVDPDKVTAEIPIEVARRYFPKREAAIKALGGANYADWAKNAEEIEKRAAKVRIPPPPARPAEPDLPITDLSEISAEIAAAPSELPPRPATPAEIPGAAAAPTIPGLADTPDTSDAVAEGR